MKPPPLSRIVGHALWLVVPVLGAVLVFGHVAWSQFDHDPDLGQGLSGGVIFAFFTAPFWVPAALIVGALLGLGAGLAVRGLAKLGRSAEPSLGAQLVAGGLGAALVAALGAVATLGQNWSPVWLVAGVLAAAFVGALAIPIAHLQVGAARPPRALGWAIATLVASMATLLGAIRMWLGLLRWDVVGDCARQLGVDESRATFAEISFPPQLWCLAGDVAEPQLPTWTGPALIAGITGSLILGVITIWQFRTPASRVWSAAACGLIGIAGLVGALAVVNPQPPAEAVEQAHELARSPHPSGSPPTTPPSAPPTSPTPTVSSRAAKSTLTTLGRIAQQAGGAELDWPQRPELSQTDCRLTDGSTGAVFFLDARFTTTDMDEVHGPVEMAEVSQANERTGQHIVDAWVASGLLSGVEVLHGEWYLSSTASSPVERAHVGFTDGVGELRVQTFCAQR